MMEEERSDVSEEQRRHCSLLLGEAECWREEGVTLVGAAGQVGGSITRLVLAAACPLLRPWLVEGGDLLLFPDLQPGHLALLCRSLLQPLHRVSKADVALLEQLSFLLGLQLLPCPPSQPLQLKDEVVEEEIHRTASPATVGPPSSPTTSPAPGASLACSLCGKTCTSSSDMEEHLAQHSHLLAHFSCDDCRRSFNSLEELSQHCSEVHGEEAAALVLPKETVHIVQEQADRRFPCDHCAKQFGTRVQLKHHMNIHLGLKPYGCTVCGKAFTQPTHLSVHRRIHDGARPYMCYICGKTFAIASNMRKHAAIHDRDVAEMTPDNRSLPTLPACNPLPFPCSHCGERFSALKHLSVHFKKEHGKQYTCPHVGCLRVCVTASQLERHVLSHTGEKPHLCPVCHKKFTQKSHLTHHMATVHSEPGSQERKHVCTQCGKCFVSKSVLKKHIMLHTNQRPHHCNICSKSFVQKSHLNVHMTQHTGDRPFTCQECGKNFTTKQHLKEHVKLHTDSKPWLVCLQCPARYRGKADLAIHMRVHTGETPFRCAECGKQFRSERSLENHRRIHSGSKPFLCDICSKRFTTPSGLRQHFKHNQRCKEGAKPGSFSSRLGEESGLKEGEDTAEVVPNAQIWLRPS